MMFKAMLTAAAASSLLAGAAFAGDAKHVAQQSVNNPPAQGAASSSLDSVVTSQTGGQADAFAETQTTTDLSAPTPATGNASATVGGETRLEVISSAPVPDTAAHRQAYGQPMSRAGKMTTPAGN